MTKIKGICVGGVIVLVEQIIDWYNRNLIAAGEAPKSGYFTLICALTGRVLFQCLIGECLNEKASENRHFSEEKGKRLYRRRCQGLTEISSWQSKDDAATQYAGAIYISGLILSFSGLPELADEAVMLCLAKKTGWAKPEQIAEIVAISENSVYSQLKVFDLAG
jgi:hypothetical protein